MPPNQPQPVRVMKLDDEGRPEITQGTVVTGEDRARNRVNVSEGGTPFDITGPGTFVLKGLPGVLLNCKVLGGTLGAMTIWDNASTATGIEILKTITPGAASNVPIVERARCTNGAVLVLATAMRVAGTID